MKGEFVNWEGKPTKVEYIGVRTLDDNFNYYMFPENPDFPAAVAALQSLVRPSLDPRSGRVLAMREDGRSAWMFVSGAGWTRQS